MKVQYKNYVARVWKNNKLVKIHYFPTKQARNKWIKKSKLVDYDRL